MLVEQSCQELGNLSMTQTVNALSVLKLVKNFPSKQVYMVNRSKERNKHISDKNEEKHSGRKIFFLIHLQKHKQNNSKQIERKIMPILDPGADVSLIHLDLIKDMFSDQELANVINTNEKITVGSFTNHTFPSMGTITLWGRLGPSTILTEFKFHIVSGQGLYYPVMFGLDLDRRMKFLKKWVVSNGPLHLIPEVTAYFPEKFKLPTAYKTLEEMYELRKNTFLSPGATKIVELRLQEINPFNEGDRVIISSKDSREIISFDALNTITDTNKLYISITNNTDRPKQLDLICSIERVPKDSVDNYVQPNILKLGKEAKYLQDVIVATGQSAKGGSDFRSNSPLPPEDNQVTNLTSFLVTKTSQDPGDSFSKLTQENIVSEDAESYTNRLRHLDITKVQAENKEIEEPRENDKFGFYKEEFNSIEEMVQLETFPPHIQPYIKDIYLDKYRNIVSRSEFDVGDLSATLGQYTIELLPGQTLPAFKRMYYLGDEDRQHLVDIVQFLEKYGIIEGVDHRDKNNKYNSNFLSPAYLVARVDKTKTARFIVDFSMLNNLIQTYPPNLPEVGAILHALRGMALFSVTDLSSAFYSMTLSKECRPLTRIMTPVGVKQFCKLPMGLKSSPSIFSTVGERMLHMTPMYDENRTLMYDPDGNVMLRYNKMLNVFLFYDDILMGSPPKATYKESLHLHFQVVEEVMKRLSFHQAKISMKKSKFAQSRIQYLGWNIQFNHILPDPARVQKLLAAPIPENKKQMRSFIGLLNTLRLCLSYQFIKSMGTLTPLTSSTSAYKLEPCHVAAFQDIQKKLTTHEVFANIVDPNAEKILFTDSSNTTFAGVLCQINESKNSDQFVPEYLALSNKVHQIIYDRKLNYRPAPLYLHDNFISKTELKKLPLEDLQNSHYHQEENFGYTLKQLPNTLYISVRSIMYVYNMTLLSIREIRKQLAAELPKGIVEHQIKDFQFNKNIIAYKEFVDKLKNDNGPLDNNLLILPLLCKAIRRHCIFISTLELHKANPIIEGGIEYNSPPFVFSIYKLNQNIVFRPYYVDNKADFDLRNFRKKMEIVGFFAKNIPDDQKKLSIYELEIQAYLLSLQHFSKLIGKSRLITLVDNKALFLCMSPKVQRDNPKIYRWALYIQFHWPALEILFIRSAKNIADFLTRSDWSTRTGDLKRIPFKNYQVTDDINGLLDSNKPYPLSEFIELVKNNEQLLLSKPDPDKIKLTVNKLNKIMKNMQTILTPINSLKLRMEHENIRKYQRIDLTEIFNECMKSENFQFTDKSRNYKIMHGLLYTKVEEEFLVYLPPTLEGLFMSYYHFSHAHAGRDKMCSILADFYFPLKITKIASFVSKCFACLITHGNIRKDTLGTYYICDYPFQAVHIDLIENLPSVYGFQHVLVILCPFSQILKTFPIKSKTSDAVLYHFYHSLFPLFQIKFVISDAGSLFSSVQFREAMHFLGIQKVDIARLSPAHNGRVERSIQSIKLAIKKYIASEKNYDWIGFLVYVTRSHNTTVSNQTGFRPLDLLYGKDAENATLNLDPKIFPNFRLLTNNKNRIEEIAIERKKMIQSARELIFTSNIKAKETLNKHRKTRKFQAGQIVFTLDRYVLPGTTRPLKTLYSSEIHVVIKDYFSSVLIQRLADGMKLFYSHYDIKGYNPHSPEFDVPAELKGLLTINILDWESEFFELVRRHSTFPLPLKALDINTEGVANKLEGTGIIKENDEITLNDEDDYLSDAQDTNNLPDQIKTLVRNASQSIGSGCHRAKSQA